MQNLSDQKLAEILPDAIILLNKKAEMLWWNSAATKVFGLKITKHKNLALQQVLDHPSLKECLLTGNEVEIKLAKRVTKYLAISTMVYDKSKRLLIARDVTHLHLLEKIRQDFVANVSHELRTPLTVIHGYLETLLDQTDKKEPYHNIFMQMQQQSIRMEKIVEDLLLLSRLEADMPTAEDLQKVSVATMLKHIHQDAISLSGNDQHKITLELDEELFLQGDEKELHSAFSNIIFNAVKYTPPKGHIAIHWYRDGDNACLTVKDTGIGVDKKHIPRLTERFYRVDKARSRASGGTGLGLAIVKHVLIRHNGYLVIESEADKGSSFTCIFKLAS